MQITQGKLTIVAEIVYTINIFQFVFNGYLIFPT